jgi:hypothetical protein
MPSDNRQARERHLLAVACIAPSLRREGAILQRELCTRCLKILKDRLSACPTLRPNTLGKVRPRARKQPANLRQQA